MATFRKTPGGWRAEVCVNGRRRSKTCRTKAAASAWADQAEHALVANLPVHTIGELFDRYAKTYSVHKRTGTDEAKRGARLAAALGRERRLAELSTDDLAAWRDTALSQRSPASVRRDWSLLNHALNVATREWQWLAKNPLARLTRPKKPRPRGRVWSGAEVAAFLYCAGHPGETKQARVGDALLLALETGLRAGEITRIRPEHVHARHVHIPTSKNGHARDVPLSTTARRILADCGNDLGLSDSQLSSLFTKARRRAGLDDLRFHDARRTALTRLAKRFDALELARIAGHRDLRILLDTYYAPDINDLADKLD